MDHTLLPTLAQNVAAEQKPSGNAAGNGQATTTSESGGQPLPTNTTKRQGADGSMMLIFAVMMVLFLFIMMGGQRKEKKKRAKLLATIKKGDKVQTAGGILGTIVELRESEVLLKVDENSNTRIKFARSSIQSLVSERAE